jgi:hypothetical protein
MTDPTAPEPSDAERRLRRLEASVEALSAEVAALRATAGGPRADRGPLAAPAAAPRPGAERAPVPAAPARRTSQVAWRGPWTDLDLESLVGRYGTMILGALTIVLGVGAFLSWAVQRVQLGPGARVLLGALAAAGVGALGFWLRGRGTRRFGNVLLALALAIVHVVAWGAGPALGVVPPAVALAAAAAASLALAALAWHDGEQALFVVGVGGALLAPFVTAREPGDPLALLGYGWFVFALSAAALRDHRWPWAARVLAAGALAYVGVALDATTASWNAGFGGGRAWVRRDAPALFVLAAAWAALVAGGRQHRSALVRQLVLVLPLAVAWRGTQTVGSGIHADLLALAALGVVTLYLALRQRDVPQPWAARSAVAQPFLLLAAALTALPRPGEGAASVVAAGLAALALLAALDAGAWPALRGLADGGADATPVPAATRATAARPALVAAPPLWALHLVVAELASALAVGLALDDLPVAGVVALAAHAAGAAWVARRAGRMSLLVPPLLVLLGASAWAGDLLAQRANYEYVPFATSASVAALAVVAAWWVAGRLAADVVRPPAAGPIERALLRALGPVAAFLWGYAELAEAFSPELAAFALILYLATVGVLLILLGRRRAVPGSRRVGLALAVIAALRAMAQASDFAAVGLRVGSYLLVGGFLLAVAYWYRAAGEPTQA